MGVLPNLFLRPIEPSVARLLNHYYRSAPARIQADAERAIGLPNSARPSRETSPARRQP
jgi:hypothetical protein